MNLDNWFQANNENKQNDINTELIGLEMKYGELFGHAIPREVLPPAITEKEIIEALKVCVTTRKDCFLQILGVKLNENHFY